MKKINRTRKRVLRRVKYKLFREALIKRVSEIVADKMAERLIYGNKVNYGEILNHILGGKNE